MSFMSKPDSEEGTEESRALVCAECGRPYAGRTTKDDELFPSGVTECTECGHDEFESVNATDLGISIGE